jgi:S-disulfanyl-L-cysteine oxidoreductase SoxD
VVAQTTPTIDLGRSARAEEIQKWDIAVGPDGENLPTGRGTAKDGAAIFGRKCAACHGPNGEGASEKALVGGKGTLATLSPRKTVGSYWPFAPIVWDYINRAMPRFQEGSLTPDEVYSVTAFLLFKNGIIGENDVMDAKSLPKVQMPNHNGFLPSKPQWPVPKEDRY